jgi:hypothetical protein
MEVNCQVHAQAALLLGKNPLYPSDSKESESQVGLDALAGRKMPTRAENRAQHIDQTLVESIDLCARLVLHKHHNVMLDIN